MRNFKLIAQTRNLRISAHPLLALLLPLTWEPGAPAHVMPIVVESDLLTYTAAGCRACKRRRCLKTRAEHCGRRYRIVGRCVHCGHDHTF
jgi:hypothetical protein